MFEKPCSPEAVSDRVLQLLRSHSCREQQTRCSRVTGLLQELGFSAKLRGYSYLREAILQMAEDPDRSIVKELYSSVGAVYGVTARHVEHSARCAIREAWSRGDPDLWALYFGDCRPTSAVFIGTLAAGLSGQEPERRKMAAGQN